MTTTDMTDHRCASMQHCPNRERLGEGEEAQWVGERIADFRGLCMSCRRHAEQAVRALPLDYTEMHVLIAADGSGMGERVSSSRALPVPINVHREGLQRALVLHATQWAEPLAEVVRITWDSHLIDHHTRPAVAVQKASRILVATLAELLRLPSVAVTVWLSGLRWGQEEWDGVDAALRFIDLHGQVRRAAGRAPLTHYLQAPCPGCDRQSLRRDNGADYVHCASCYDRWSEEDYRRLCLVLSVAA